MPVGMRAYTQVERPDRAIVEQFREFLSVDLSDAMNLAYIMDRAIGPAYSPIPKVVGTAITVAVPTGAQNVRRVAMELCQEGDVLVINAYGISAYAQLGDNLAKALQAKGVAGVIIDGAFRDLMAFREMQYPVFARSVATYAGPKQGQGEVNVPIACGNVVVNPGDIIVADEDGIAVVPKNDAEDVLVRVKDVVAKFEAVQERLKSGEVTGSDTRTSEEVLEDLKSQGFEIR
jgi:4-hydroxy-4-methyl-2-oxoglutarate aldolase